MTTLSITIKKTGRTYEREVESFPPATVAYLLQNGFSQRLRDVHASVKREDYDAEEAWLAEVNASVEEALAQMDTGNVPGTRAPSDPRAAAVRKAAKELEAAGVDATNFLDMTDEERAAIARVFAKRVKKAA